MKPSAFRWVVGSTTSGLAYEALGRTLLGMSALALAACGGSDGRGEEQTGGSGIASASAGGESGDAGGSADEGADATGGGSGSADEGGLDTGGAACTSDEDCPEGTRCTEETRVCLVPTACMSSGDCDEGFTCEEGECTIGGDCGGFAFEIEAIPPNLMILLDRSGSMDGGVDGTNQNRWEVAKQAIAQVTTTFDDSIRFGLATYSSCVGNGCSAGSIVIPISANNAAPINDFLATTAGEGSGDGMGTNGSGQTRYLCDSGDPETSTGKSLAGLVAEPSLADVERTNAVMLITDGSESGECIDNGVNGPSGASMLLAQDPPVLTYAVGFVGANESELQAIAAAGGTNQSYFASNPAMLEAAFDSIAQAVTSCTFTLDQVPPDPSLIFVFFDKDPAGVPNDPGNGWTYDPATNTITFHGQACMDIQSGAVVEIDIVYGCNMPPVG